MAPSFPISDGCLMIGGVPLPRLASRVGRTPFFAYERSHITQRVHQLRALLPPELLLHYSVKANPMPALVQHLSSLVDGFDVASFAEMKVALDTPVRPHQIGFAGPGKTNAELGCAISAGVVLHIESEGELQRVQGLADALGAAPQVVLRVNPEFELKLSGMKMGGGAKPFGIDAKRVPAVLKGLTHAGIEFLGFHIFSGSQNLHVDAIIEEKRHTFELARQLSNDAPGPVRLLNIGGGFGIPYFPGQTALDMQPIGEALKEEMALWHSSQPQTKIILELGRYLVGEAGIYVTRVIDRKVSQGQTFLITDGGMNHHLAASGNLGQVIRKNYPVVIGNRMLSEEREIVNVVGPLCTPLDVLAEKVEMAHAQIGDLVVVFQSGAYGCSASPHAFLGHPSPIEVLV